MRVVEIDWIDPQAAARAIRSVVARTARPTDVKPIQMRVENEGDTAVLDLTNRLDATENPRLSLRLDPGEGEAALAALDPALRESLELAIENIRAVATAQVDDEVESIALPQGQTVTVRSVPVASAGIYAPGGRAAYPSSVLMCAVPARAAGVGRLALASPPGPDGRIAAPVLAAATLCGIDEIYAMGGAQAIFALAQGTDEVEAVDVIVGPGNAWVQDAKRAVYGTVGIDSYAGPSELLVVAGADTDPRAAALDLCAQAEHGEGGVLALASTDRATIDAIWSAAREFGERPGIDPGALVNTVVVPSARDAIELANALAPEHLELLDPDAAAMASDVKTAGCVFTGRGGATAFGDYVAGSNHVLPTGGAGRFSGPLGPGVFRRKIATVQVPPEAAAKLAPHVDRIARAEGFPIHGESAMIRVEDDRS
ncbi:MAG TPA: histidinol dehydrogenase [Solirubrobacterales bacterium]|nr:histidinol dehydrogenase [Solirubrobacterales bacterium]